MRKEYREVWVSEDDEEFEDEEDCKAHELTLLLINAGHVKFKPGYDTYMRSMNIALSILEKFDIIERKPPALWGKNYFIPDFCERTAESFWKCDSDNRELLESSLLHLTREAAERHTEALLKLNKMIMSGEIKWVAE